MRVGEWGNRRAGEAVGERVGESENGRKDKSMRRL